jgi:hypothetical protein
MAATLLLAASCAHQAPAPTPTPTPTISSPTAAATASPFEPVRTAVIVMENHSYGQILGKAHYLTSLADRYALATNYSAVAHPSLPNYLALVGGDTFGVRSDCTDCYVNRINITDANRAGLNWRAYMEGMPRPCFPGASFGRYAKKHDPFMYFDNIRLTNRCHNVVPLSELDDAHLPDFTWITPDLCNDMHDCSVATGDAFLRRIVPGLLRGLGPHGVLFITFDEGTSDQHVVLIAAGDGVKPGRYAQAFTHYSLLRTVLERVGVCCFANAASAPSLAPMLKSL